MGSQARKVIQLFKPPSITIDVPDAEFLAPGLELIATPPSPVRMKLIVAICALFAIALTASVLCKIDIYAVASARIQPAGRSKIVQPLAAGKVRSLYVENGSLVQQGQLLLELDPTEPEADHNAGSALLDSLKAEIARRNAAVTAARTPALLRAPIEVQFEPEVPPSVREREEAVLHADLGELLSGLEALEARIGESVAQKRASQMTIGEQEILVKNMQERVGMRDSVLQRGLESRIALLDAQSLLSKELTALAAQRGQLLTADAAINSFRKQQADLLAKFIADNTQKITEAQVRRDETEQTVVKSSAKLSQTRILAPISGSIQELSVTTIGQVIASGQQLMTVVPDQRSLQAEAMVANRDIGFLTIGQTAVLKIDAYPFTRYGVITGKVVRISNDAVESREAVAATSQTGVNVSPETSAAAPTPQTQNLVYPVTISLDKAQLLVDGKYLPLSPGMSASVDIRTGQRRIIEYLLSPILEVTAESAHER